ncbi:MAG: phosphohistidine phosphatase SixA [Chloroflexi bacterium]|nr:phosphohistidine phosphatase SixA [Chloroflexota bacterium]
MKLYFLRHGLADWEHWEKPDDARPLTKKGRKQVAAVAKALQELKVRPNVILTSPLPRAAETAEIVSAELEIDCVACPQLAPGFDLNALRQLLNEHPGRDVLLVGHEPDFSRVIALLTGGNVRMAKAGLARIDVEDGAGLSGELAWLAPPKVLKAI